MHPRLCERSQAQKVCTAGHFLHKVSRTDEFVKMEGRLSGVGGGVKGVYIIDMKLPVEGW